MLYPVIISDQWFDRSVAKVCKPLRHQQQL
jgi:hypothetical protein